LHYRDGGSKDLPIVYGHDVRDWWLGSGSPIPSEGPNPAWVGLADRTRPAESAVCLFKSSYDNPEPEREVVRITFESSMTTSAPFLLAVMVEP
jgi:hypothetical protein